MQPRETNWKPALSRAATIGAILAAFVLVRLPLLTNEAAVRGWNGDTAIFGLMAKKIHDGKGFDVFFWGQNYMGPLTPALAAAIRRTVLDPAGLGAEGGPISLRLASMSEIAFGICLYFLGLTRLFGRTIAAAAGLWMAIGPPFLIRLSAVPRGPEMSFALGFGALLPGGRRPDPAASLPGPPRRPFHSRAPRRVRLVDEPDDRLRPPAGRGPRPLPVRSVSRVSVGSAGSSLSLSWRGRARFMTPLLCGFALGYSPVWMGRLLGWYEPALGPVVPTVAAVRPSRPLPPVPRNGLLAVRRTRRPRAAAASRRGGAWSSSSFFS